MNLFYRLFSRWFASPAQPRAKPIRFILSFEQSAILHESLENLNINLEDITTKDSHPSLKGWFYRFLKIIFLII